MPSITRRRRRAATAAVLVLVVGCNDAPTVATTPVPTVPVTPATPAAPFEIFALSSRLLSGAPGTAVREPPRVRVRDEFNKGLSSIDVTFAVTRGGGAVARAHALTDAQGIASCDAWVLGGEEGPNTLTASIERARNGVSAVVFEAQARRPVAVFTHDPERFDLLSIGGIALPRTYSGGGATWTIVRVHYLFRRDGTFTFSSISTGSRGGDSVAVEGVWSLDAPTASGPSVRIEFPGGPIGAATLSADRLFIVYDDWLDWEPEVYVRVDPSDIESAPLTPSPR